jgi:RNA polymerase sigma-70 factor (ECF subfamily)
MDIERLINRHKDAVYKQVVKVCGNHEDTEDALAEAFAEAFKASDRLKNPDSFQAWLAKVGSRVCVRKKIAARLAKSVSLADLEAKGKEIIDPQRSPDEETESRVLSECIQCAIDSLPEIYRDVYYRREILGESAEEVSSALKISIAAVKSRLHRAREMARTALDDGFGCADLIDASA